TFLHYAEVQRKTDSCSSGIAARAAERTSGAASTGGRRRGTQCAGSLLPGRLPTPRKAKLP
ncbi:Hypothetical predicted protein, partial [Marmota monax]